MLGNLSGRCGRHHAVKVTTAHVSEIYTADIMETVKGRTFPLTII